jgi:hypothetical protein
MATSRTTSTSLPARLKLWVSRLTGTAPSTSAQAATLPAPALPAARTGTVARRSRAPRSTSGATRARSGTTSPRYAFASTSPSVRPAQCSYGLHQIYGFNVGMKIATGDGSCPGFACGQLWNGCPVPGPSVAGQWNSCFSGCCSSAGACANGALPAGGGGCTQNAGPGPHSSFFYNNCPNAYAFPDNDGTRRAWLSARSSVLTRFVGAAGYSPANFVDYTCGNTDVTLTLCPGGSSHYSK